VIACPFLLERLGLAEWRQLLGTVLASAGIFLVLYGINRWAYQRDPAWAEFSEYNRLRGEIQVTTLAGFVPQAAPTVGWSKKDGWMFSQFYFSDPDVRRCAQDVPFLGQAEGVGARQAGIFVEIFGALSVSTEDISISARHGHSDEPGHSEYDVVHPRRGGFSSSLPGHVADFLQSFYGALFLSLKDGPPARTRLLQHPAVYSRHLSLLGNRLPQPAGRDVPARPA
jgi:hypothetical protein